MTLLVRPLDRSHAQTLLAAHLRCRASVAALHTALIADHIRSLVWAPYLRAAEANPQPVHTSRIYAALDRNMHFLLSEEADAGRSDYHPAYEFVRNQLERCGDIVSVGEGYWIPGPVRLIRAAAAPAAIIIGGTPTAALERALKGKVHSIGPARYVASEPGTETAFPEETLLDWIGASEPLAAWTEQTLEWAAAQLVPQAEIDDDSIEIYAPDVYRSRRRPGFWMKASEFEEPTPTPRLFRPRTSAQWSFDRPDYLGVFNSLRGGARLVGSLQIPRDMAYRLRFGFDLKLITPRTISVRQVEDVYAFDLKFDLPAPEAKVLGLAWAKAGQESVLYVDRLGLSALKDVAAMLGIRVLQS